MSDKSGLTKEVREEDSPKTFSVRKLTCHWRATNDLSTQDERVNCVTKDRTASPCSDVNVQKRWKILKHRNK